MTNQEFKGELAMLRGQLHEANAQLANTRTQLLQMQSVAEYLDDHYYKPMTRGVVSRIWFAVTIKRKHERKQ